MGRTIYGMRLAIGEPPFAHIRSAIVLDRFNLRGKKKVNTQWNLFCMVHNLRRCMLMEQDGCKVGTTDEKGSIKAKE